MIPVERCCLCGGSDHEPWTSQPRGPNDLHFAQVRCRGCGTLLAQPRASAEEMAAFYGSTYYRDLWPEPDDATFEQYVRAHADHDWAALVSLAGPGALSAGMRVAEIGCGYGSFLELSRRRGLEAVGCDCAESAVESAARRGLRAVVGGSPDLPFESGGFDAAVALQVVEHLEDPLALLTGMHRILRPGGLAVVATEPPSTSRVWFERNVARLRGRTPRFRTSTDHTFVPEPRALAKAMEDAGFVDVRWRCYSEGISPGSFHFTIYKRIFAAVDRIVGTGTLLMVVGRRR